jgi:hypothetical protein
MSKIRKPLRYKYMRTPEGIRLWIEWLETKDGSRHRSRCDRGKSDKDRGEKGHEYVVSRMLDIRDVELATLRELRAVVIRVLSQKGDDVCWRDVYTEMAHLVGVEFVPVVLDKPTMERNCKHFIKCLLDGEHYIAPSVKETERLRLEVAYQKRRIAFYRERWEAVVSRTEAENPNHDKDAEFMTPEQRAKHRVQTIILDWESRELKGSVRR